MHAGTHLRTGFACWVALVAASLFPSDSRGRAHADPPPEGKVYHVAQKHPKADDANPGTEALPWRTIGHAAARALAGE